ncbi:MAG: sulfatase-like hydrolase/transferase, partial [Planctomycetaceae bacterium]
MKHGYAGFMGMLTLLLWTPGWSRAADSEPRPNCVLILADDLGYGDLACYGQPRVQTPHIDQLAADGLRLTSCYSTAANCSPARAGLMTGRTPSRVGIYNWIPGLCPMHVRRSELTIATLLRNAGYDTCQSGKWHLNGDLIPFGTPASRALKPIAGLAGTPDVRSIKWPSQPQPWDHGFNHWFSTQNNALPNHRNPNNFVRNGKPVGPLRGYAADLVADEAISWMESKRDATRPFFLFLC